MLNSQHFKKLPSFKEENIPNKISLEAELLRVKVLGCLKDMKKVWLCTSEQLCEMLQMYGEIVEGFRVEQLFGLEGCRLIRMENKIYFGQVANKQKNGKGLSVCKDGKVYLGDFSNNEKQGFGVEIYGNGNLYIGHFVHNKKHGEGRFYWFNLSPQTCIKDISLIIEQYHGGWWGGLPDGDGRHVNVKGDVYEGQFKNGLKHGNGKEEYANGDVYKGEFINGLPEGNGNYLFKNKSTYNGDFKQGYRSGHGYWMGCNGENYKGHFLLDRRHGFGVLDEGNGNIFKGFFVEDMKSGHGQMFKNGVMIFEGQWENDKQMDEEIMKEEKIFTASSRENSGLNFRVKTSKMGEAPIHRRNSAATVRLDNGHMNFRLSESRASTFRKCFCCTSRTHSKAKQTQNLINPEYI